MALWVVVLLYIGGVALVILEALLPGMVIGFIGMIGLVISIVYGFQHDWIIGTAQIVIAVVVIPLMFYFAFKRLAVKTSLSVETGGVSFGKDWSVYLARGG